MTSIDLEKLTKKNQEFIHIATNRMIQNGKTDAEIKAILTDILPTLIDHQARGITARQLFEAPTVWADSLSAPNPDADNPRENDNPWLMWIDASLFILGLMGLITGFLTMSSSQSQTYGILSLLLLSLSTGAMMYAMYFYVYRHLRKPKQERPGGIMIWVKLFGIMVALFFIFSLSTLLPVAINPVLPPLGTMIIGALALGTRYLLKKRYNIKSAITSKD